MEQTIASPLLCQKGLGLNHRLKAKELFRFLRKIIVRKFSGACLVGCREFSTVPMQRQTSKDKNNPRKSLVEIRKTEEEKLSFTEHIVCFIGDVKGLFRYTKKREKGIAFTQKLLY